MYTRYFGLNEVPFSIAPNPHYLFMSDRHREALAHLTYGMGETGGFVLLTGEVGTGKTTVSRCLLEQLPENTQAAFILNPTLSAQELLATICDELKIRYRKTGATLKTLTDKIQFKLLKNHEAGIHTLLIIDEAQHLQAEVLEQLRLLTNLETHTKKLLQVILIGQPELQQLLKRRDLRQLAQRITARYHLLPLNQKEVHQYIFHRLQVAGCQRMLFSPGAVNYIHQISGGIPRLINLICDRALLGAFGMEKSLVDKKLVKGAAMEALGEEYHPPQLYNEPWFQKTVAASVAAILLLTLIIGFWPEGEKEPIDREKQVVQAQVDKPVLQDMQGSRSLPMAFSYLMTLWQIELDDALDEPCETANEFGLNCFWYKGNLTGLAKLNYPAILKLIDNEGQAFYGTLTGKKVDDELWPIRLNGREVLINQQWLDEYWQGSAVVLWQAPNGYNKQIDENSEASQIQWLENKLSEKQNRPARQIAKFDKLLLNQLAQFQRQNGIESSPVANQKTVMLLSNTVSKGMPKFN